MSKLKNIFKLSILGVASLSLLSGAGLVLSQTDAGLKANADTTVSVNNTTPDFFNATWKNSSHSVVSDLSAASSPLVLANSGDYINLRFDTENQRRIIYSKAVSGSTSEIGTFKVEETPTNKLTLTRCISSVDLTQSKAEISYRINGIRQDTVTLSQDSNPTPTLFKSDDPKITLTNDKESDPTKGILTFEFNKGEELEIDFIKVGDEKIYSTEGPYLHGKDNTDDATWDCFQFTDFTLTRDGKKVDFTKDNTSGFITKQINTDSSYYYSAPVGNETMDFDLDVKLGTGENALNGRTLTLTSEGVYEITISYTMYSTIDGGRSWESVSTGPLVWSFMLFNHETYLESGLNKPRVADAYFEQENNTYFYRFNKDSLPYIEYDPTRYNLTVTKSYGQDDSTVKLVYDHYENVNKDYRGNVIVDEDGNVTYNTAFVDKYKDNGLFELKLTNSRLARLYFKDLGKYSLNFELVYSTNIKDGDVQTYILPHNAEDKTLYLFGYQSTYTKFNTQTSTNEYPEFKTYNDDFTIKESADITRNITTITPISKTAPSISLDGITPVKTNQSPVKFKEYGNFSNAYLYPVNKTETTTGGTTTLSIGTGTQITATKNVSLRSTDESSIKYLAIFEYTFENYVSGGLSDPNEKFYQVFYFEITNETPKVAVRTDLGENKLSSAELPSRDYTNKDVYIYNDYSNSTFNSTPIIRIDKYDYITKQSSTKYLEEYEVVYATSDNFSFQLTKDETHSNAYYKISGNGNYTINIFSGRNGESGTPITRKFNIDDTAIESVDAYSVRLKNTSEYVRATSNLDTLTNQPLIFTWRDVKASGARTKAYYKYYPLEANGINYNDNIILSNFLQNEHSMPVSYTLNLTATPSWIRYTNAEGLINSSSISPSYVKTAAGLYVLYIVDDAGNEAVAFYLLDNTSMNFVIQKISGMISNFSLLTGNDSLSQDATIYWGENKVFRVDGTSVSGVGLKDGSTISGISEAFDKFKQKYISNITAVSSSHQGNYIKIPYIKSADGNTKLLFKNLGVQNASFTSFEGNKFDIVSSFGLHKSYISDANDILYFLSSTTGTYYQTTVEDLEKCYAGTITPYEMYLNAKERPLTGTNPDFNTIYRDHMTDYTESDGKYQSIYNREGVLSFMLRDEANTKSGVALTEELEYLNYPTGSQVINLTSDKSKFSVVYDNGDKKDELLQADTASQEGKIDSNGTLTASNKQKNAFYYPTTIEQKLYISFIPRVVNGDEIIQVELVNVKFYPFVNKLYSTNSGFGEIKAKLNYYKTLSDTPTINMGISFDSTATTAQNFELNIVNGKTQEGKYIITRTYVEPKTADDGKTYVIDKYDFMKRTISFIVDRENVISEPEVIEAKTTTYYFKGGIEISTIGSLLVSNTDLGGKAISEELGKDGYYVKASIAGKEVKTSQISRIGIATPPYFYKFDGVIDSIQLFKDDAATPIEPNKSISSPEQSAQSIVGNGILVSVFSGSASSKEYPSLKTTANGYADYNSGYTFFTTAQGFNANLDPDNFTQKFETNKRPFMIYIPEYKYTTHNDSANNSFSSKRNEDLSIFKAEKQLSDNTQFIDYYKLTAVIYKDTAEQVYARSSGSGENGFLKFKKENGKELTEFREIGMYYVVITQGSTSMAGINSFQKNYTFAFNVTSGKPDYSIFDSKGYELQGPKDSNNNLTGGLYTNEKTIVAKWTDSPSEYITNIDVKKIGLSFNGKKYDIVLNKENNANITTSPSGGADNITAALKYSFNQTTLANELSIDLEKIGCYKNNSAVSISMQLENPSNDTSLYETVTKTIIVDTSIYDINGDSYTTTTEELFEKIKGYSSSLSFSSLRTFLNISGQETTNKDETCFSQTAASDFYRYYTYQVDKNFFTNLKNSIESNRISNQSGKTSVYVRDLEKNIFNGSFEETSHDAFFTSNSSFKNLDNYNDIQADKYYEIIETDYAGNLNIYLVYYCGEISDTTSIQYSIDDESKSLNDSQIDTNKYNVYGNTSLKINEIKFRNDEWNFIKLEQSGTTTNYVRTPWLGVGYVHNLDTGETVEFSTLLDNASAINKTIVNISDRVSGTWKTVYFSKANTTTLNLEGVSSDEEGIMIKLPAGDVLTSNAVVVYPTEITINIGSTETKIIKNNPLDDVANSAAYQTSWVDSSNEFKFEYNSTTGYLKMTFITLPPRGTRVKYTATDNFGNSVSTIHLYGSDYTDSFEHTGNLYQQVDADGNLYNYVQNSFTYKYNNTVYKINVLDEDGKEITDLNSGNINLTPGTTINSITFSKKASEQLDRKFEIRVLDIEDEKPVKSVFVRLYDVLPRITGGTLSSATFLDQNGNSINDKFNTYSETINVNGKDYACYSAKTFASVVTLSYESGNFDIPYSAFICKDGESEFNAVEPGYRISESGIYYIMFKYLSDSLFTNEYRMYKLEVLDSTSNFFYVTLDGNVVKAEKSYYTDTDDKKQYANYYLVNVAHSEKARVKIETNVYQQIQTPTSFKTITKQGVTTVIYSITNKIDGTYPTGVSPYNDYVVISYIPASTSPSNKFSYILEGNDISIVNESKAIVAMSQDSTDKNLTLKWSSYFGLQENKIKLEIEKDGKILDLPIYYESDNVSYTILEISGLYKIRIIDNAGNIQKFGANDYFELIYLRDPHFTMIHEENGEEIKTEAIDKGIFNKAVKIVLENVAAFYLPSSENKIIAKRNGVDYTPAVAEGTSNTYLFTEVGYYQVSFKATASNGTELRQQVYTFTIINPNESRYAFSYSAFDTYMITKVLKDDGITEVKDLTSIMGNKDSIYVSYYNEDTGRWTVTIDTNKKLNTADNETTKFTFSFLIRSALPPIEVSLPEGNTTTEVIKVSFNAVNIYNTVGDCILTCGNDEYKINASTCDSLGVVELSLNVAGTYFIQVTTESGNLLYSYMVVKKDPLNAWAIVAIVLGVAVAIVVVIIVVRLRKRIKVK